MKNAEIEEFARLLVMRVRDAAIRSCDQELRPDVESPTAKRWRAARVREGGIPPEMLIADCVDMAVFQLLYAIDQGSLPLMYKTALGKSVDLTEEGLGELAGWYVGGGWRVKYSKERLVDEFSDED